MSIEVPEPAVEEITRALHRSFASFPTPEWTQKATLLMAPAVPSAALQLAPDEPVEWATPGSMHRNGKIWPSALLLVTPHRLIISATRKALRTKREVLSLYRGPESLTQVSCQRLPGADVEQWVIEIATQQGPLHFAVPNFGESEPLARATATFVTGRARYATETGTLLDGVPWGATEPTPHAAAFEAARADLADASVQGAAAPTERREDPLPATPAAAPRPGSYAPPVLNLRRSPAPAAASADWYPDPLAEAGLRYWDGQSWTRYTAG